MPIVDVEMVIAATEATEPGLAAALADAVGEVLESEAGSVWVRLRRLSETRYAENGGGPPDGVRPVFVTVLLAHVPEGAALQDQVRRLTDVIAAVCNRPAENVHVLYLPEARGRMAFGGRLVE